MSGAVESNLIEKTAKPLRCKMLSYCSTLTCRSYLLVYDRVDGIDDDHAQHDKDKDQNDIFLTDIV